MHLPTKNLGGRGSQVGSVLSALDLAFPTAVKCGGVSADLLPSRKRVAVAAYEREHGTHPLQAGVAGILLPPDVTWEAQNWQKTRKQLGLLGGGFKHFLCFSLPGERSNLTSIYFQMG